MSSGGVPLKKRRIESDSYGEPQAKRKYKDNDIDIIFIDDDDDDDDDDSDDSSFSGSSSSSIIDLKISAEEPTQDDSVGTTSPPLNTQPAFSSIKTKKKNEKRKVSMSPTDSLAKATGQKASNETVARSSNLFSEFQITEDDPPHKKPAKTTKSKAARTANKKAQEKKSTKAATKMAQSKKNQVASKKNLSAMEQEMALMKSSTGSGEIGTRNLLDDSSDEEDLPLFSTRIPRKKRPGPADTSTKATTKAANESTKRPKMPGPASADTSTEAAAKAANASTKGPKENVPGLAPAKNSVKAATNAVIEPTKRPKGNVPDPADTSAEAATKAASESSKSRACSVLTAAVPRVATDIQLQEGGSHEKDASHVEQKPKKNVKATNTTAPVETYDLQLGQNEATANADEGLKARTDQVPPAAQPKLSNPTGSDEQKGPSVTTHRERGTKVLSVEKATNAAATGLQGKAGNVEQSKNETSPHDNVSTKQNPATRDAGKVVAPPDKASIGEAAPIDSKKASYKKPKRKANKAKPQTDEPVLPGPKETKKKPTKSKKKKVTAKTPKGGSSPKPGRKETLNTSSSSERKKAPANDAGESKVETKAKPREEPSAEESSKRPFISKSKKAPAKVASEDKAEASKVAQSSETSATAAKTAGESKAETSKAAKSANTEKSAKATTNGKSAASTSNGTAKQKVAKANAAGTKPKPKPKKKRYDQQILHHMVTAMKPFSLRCLAQELKTTEQQLHNTLLAMKDKKLVFEKDFTSTKGRTKTLIWANLEAKEATESDYTPEKASEAVQEVQLLIKQERALQQELTTVTASPCNKELNAQIESEEAVVAELRQRLEETKERIRTDKARSEEAPKPAAVPGFGFQPKPKSAAQLARERCPRRMKMRINTMRSEWKSRKDKCRDFVDTMADAMEKKPKAVYDMLDLETDEMVGVVMPEKYQL